MADRYRSIRGRSTHSELEYVDSNCRGSTTHTHTDRTPHRSAREAWLIVRSPPGRRDDNRCLRKHRISSKSPCAAQDRTLQRLLARVRASDCSAGKLEIGKRRSFSKLFDRFPLPSGRIPLVRKIPDSSAHGPERHGGDCQQTQETRTGDGAKNRGNNRNFTFPSFFLDEEGPKLFPARGGTSGDPMGE